MEASWVVRRTPCYGWGGLGWTSQETSLIKGLPPGLELRIEAKIIESVQDGSWNNQSKGSLTLRRYLTTTIRCLYPQNPAKNVGTDYERGWTHKSSCGPGEKTQNPWIFGAKFKTPKWSNRFAQRDIQWWATASDLRFHLGASYSKKGIVRQSSLSDGNRQLDGLAGHPDWWGQVWRCDQRLHSLGGLPSQWPDQVVGQDSPPEGRLCPVLRLRIGWARSRADHFDSLLAWGTSENGFDLAVRRSSQASSQAREDAA